MVEPKDIVFLILGIIIGLLAGIAIYWLPLGQFINEVLAISNMVFNRYTRNDKLTVKPFVSMKPLDSQNQPIEYNCNHEMQVANDEGVGWHHTAKGWKRARILHVFDPMQEGSQNLYKICHLDIQPK